MSPPRAHFDAVSNSPEFRLIAMLQERFDDLKSDLGSRIDKLQNSFDKQEERALDHEDRIRNLEDPRISQVRAKVSQKEGVWEIVWKWGMRSLIATFFIWETWREGLWNVLRHFFNQN